MMSGEVYNDCPFCNAAIHASVFFENDRCLAVYNIAPVLPGHSLVIPKHHATSLLQLSPDEMMSFFETSRIALRILMKAFHTDAFDWSIQEKPEAGQTIEHLHLHIVPRIKEDLHMPGDWYPLISQNDAAIIDSVIRPRLNPDEMAKIVTRLRRIDPNH